MIQVLSSSHEKKYQDLSKGWGNWLSHTHTTERKIFNPSPGVVCAVTTIGNQSLHPLSPSQSYQCEGTGVLNDPYEGELFTWWLYFFSNLSTSEKEALWTVQRPQLVSVDYEMKGFGPVTVQKVYRFSAHEQWKVLEMPYYDIPIVKTLDSNTETVRTCNSKLLSIPGLFASVNN